ncbi:hypothetical protein ACFE04_009540 [Oxalis oulophora]
MARSVEKNYILLTLFFLLSTYVAVLVAGWKDTDECPELSCKPDGPVVRFPFRIKGKHAHHCGYKGFEISCSTTNDSILQLPDRSENLSVTEIDYFSQQLSVHDPTASSSCLPRKLNTYKLSSSPFQFDPLNTFNVTLFNCSLEIWPGGDFYSTEICADDYGRQLPWLVDCPAGDQRYQLIALKTHFSACFLVGAMSCNKLYDAAVTYKVYALPGIILSWYTPNCRHCEKGNGKCVANKNKYREHEVDCLAPPNNTVMTDCANVELKLTREQ